MKNIMYMYFLSVRYREREREGEREGEEERARARASKREGGVMVRSHGNNTTCNPCNESLVKLLTKNPDSSYMYIFSSVCT